MTNFFKLYKEVFLMQTFIVEKKQITYLPIDKIIPNPYQPRKKFDQKALSELTSSIIKYGILEPICVRAVRGIYEVIAGERRLIAAKRAGFYEVPCIITNITDKDSASLALIENMQREDLNFFEEAEGFQTLMVNFGYTQEEIASIVGKSLFFIHNKMNILKLSKELKNAILENNLTEKHAIAILRLSSPILQKEVLDKVIKYGLNAKKTELLVNKIIRQVYQTNKTNRQKIKGFITDLKIFTNSIKTAVDMMKEAGVSTNYSITKLNDGYEINIKVCI